jgi:predicted nucleic acid-binding protein
MLRYFLDTSALIKLYHEEEGTEVVDNLVSQNQPVIVISDLSGLEMVSAMSRKVRAQEIKPETFTAVLIAFEADLPAFDIQLVTGQTMSEARQLLKDWGIAYGLRSLDAIQLAVALSANRRQKLDLFVAADKRLTAVAEQESLPTLFI